MWYWNIPPKNTHMWSDISLWRCRCSHLPEGICGMCFIRTLKFRSTWIIFTYCYRVTYLFDRISSVTFTAYGLLPFAARNVQNYIIQTCVIFWISGICLRKQVLHQQGMVTIKWEWFRSKMSNSYNSKHFHVLITMLIHNSMIQYAS